jgi:peptidoglycan/xylan/chitin deacetylase (PgdA/CDA1 family)
MQKLRANLWRFVFLLLTIGGLSDGYMQGAASEQTDAVFWDGTLRRIRAPILMYHYVSELPPDSDDIRRELTVSPAQFRDHLAMLFFEGYSPVSLYALHRALMHGEVLPPKPVILTFDDAYIDHYAHVYPALRERGFIATFFIPTAFIDEARPGYMTWEQIAEMAQNGMSMEPHTKTHRELNGLSYDALVYETLGSIESLAFYTGQTPHMFSYPVGRYDDFTLEIFAQMPIWRAVTTQSGSLHTTDNQLEVSRVRVPGGASASVMRAIVRGG